MKILILIFLSVALALSASAQSTSFTVEPGKYNFRQLQVPDGERVAVNFTAQGGSGNDIECYVMDDEAFQNFKNGHSAKTYYNSGRVTAGHFDLTLPAGTYYFIFSNKFSTFSNKVVTVSVPPEPKTAASQNTRPTQADTSSENEPPDDFVTYCYLSNNGKAVNVRRDCNEKSCDNNTSTLVGSYPDEEKVYVLNIPQVEGTKGFSWVPVQFESDGRQFWVASTKLDCRPTGN